MSDPAIEVKSPESDANSIQRGFACGCSRIESGKNRSAQFDYFTRKICNCAFCYGIHLSIIYLDILDHLENS